MRDRIHSDLSNQAVETYRTARNRLTEYPGTIAAILIGIGVTAALLWAARRAGGWRNLQDQAVAARGKGSTSLPKGTRLAGAPSRTGHRPFQTRRRSTSSQIGRGAGKARG